LTITDFHFKDYLNTSYINKVKKEFGFNEGRIIEQFIIDFEMLYHIQKIIPNLIVKGGMSVPFHIQKNLRRLSQDVDIVTPLSKAEIESAMRGLSAEANGFFTISEPHKPENPAKSLPLLTYFVPFQSNIGTDNPEVKIEFFYDFKEAIQTKQIDPGAELIDFKLDYPIKVFDKGSLIGDKLTTLGFKTIGVPHHRRSDVIKHIYDIALLIKEIPEKYVLEEISKTYDTIANYENSLLTGKKFSKQEMIDDILISLDSLLVQDSGYSLEKSHEGMYCTFKTQLLGRGNAYPRLSHVNDIMLIKLLSQYLHLVIHGKMKLSEFVDSFFHDLEGLENIVKQGAKEKIVIRKEIIKTFDTKTNGNFINKLPQTEQVFLFSKIEQLKKRNRPSIV